MKLRSASTYVNRSSIINTNYRKNEYTITFQYNNGSEDVKVQQTVEHGSTVNRIEDPTRTDYYDFAGWYTTPEFTTMYNFENIVTSEFTLYGKWERSSVTVTYDAGEGGTIDGNQTKVVDAKYGDTILIINSTPIKSGYTFLNWSDKTGRTYTAGDSLNITSDLLD